MAKSAPKTAPATSAGDPLLEAINHYRAGGELYDDLPADLPEAKQDAELERLCIAPERVLAHWRDPATTQEGAIAALRLALTELEKEDVEPMHLNMIRIGLRFLEEWRPS